MPDAVLLAGGKEECSIQIAVAAPPNNKTATRISTTGNRDFRLASSRNTGSASGMATTFDSTTAIRRRTSSLEVVASDSNCSWGMGELHAGQTVVPRSTFWPQCLQNVGQTFT